MSNEAPERNIERIYVQIYSNGFSAFESDPREVHDNGKPVYEYVRATEIAKAEAKVWDRVVKIVAEICDGALRHYDEVSSMAHHWCSTVVHALEFYREHGPTLDRPVSGDTPVDLIAYKWVETLSASAQNGILAGDVKRLSEMIVTATAARPKVSGDSRESDEHLCEFKDCGAIALCFHYCGKHHKEVCNPPTYAAAIDAARPVVSEDDEKLARNLMRDCEEATGINLASNSWPNDLADRIASALASRGDAARLERESEIIGRLNLVPKELVDENYFRGRQEGADAARREDAGIAAKWEKLAAQRKEIARSIRDDRGVDVENVIHNTSLAIREAILERVGKAVEPIKPPIEPS